MFSKVLKNVFANESEICYLILREISAYGEWSHTKLLNTANDQNDENLLNEKMNLEYPIEGTMVYWSCLYLFVTEMTSFCSLCTEIISTFQSAKILSGGNEAAVILGTILICVSGETMMILRCDFSRLHARIEEQEHRPLEGILEKSIVFTASLIIMTILSSVSTFIVYSNIDSNDVTISKLLSCSLISIEFIIALIFWFNFSYYGYDSASDIDSVVELRYAEYVIILVLFKLLDGVSVEIEPEENITQPIIQSPSNEEMLINNIKESEDESPVHCINCFDYCEKPVAMECCNEYLYHKDCIVNG